MIGHPEASTKSPESRGRADSLLGWREMALRRNSSTARKRRRLLTFLSILLLICLLLTAIRFSSVASATADHLTIRIGNQQPASIDLRQELPINPGVFGSVVYPQFGTSSKDGATGTMYYNATLASNMESAHIGLLRFPGGNWGEEHYLSLDQLNTFSTLLQKVHADGMIQARLSGPIGNSYTELKDITTRAHIAAAWVDFMNNPKSDQRVGPNAHAPFHPVKDWTVGNEPDKLINPMTGKVYTVQEYVNDFIQFSLAMHQSDPTIQVFGPEISQFNGPGAGPRDASGQLWMEGFLKGVAAYQQSHPALTFSLLNGVSFHYYQSMNSGPNAAQLLSSAGAWSYFLPLLHQMISQNFHKDLPVAVTEINTNPINQDAPAPGLATLWWADTLGNLMEQQVDDVVFASTSGINTPYPLFTTQNLRPTPMFRVMQVFSHLQSYLVPVSIQRDPISLYATQDADHQNLSLLFINKSGEPQLAQISADEQPFTLNPWHNLTVSLAAYSMVVITLHRNGGDEAYSYLAPQSTMATTASLLHTICGHKTDALATTIPC